MSTSEPKPTAPAASHQSRPALAGIDADSLKSTVPMSSHVLLVGIMLLFFSVLTLITLQVGWAWWLIPAVIAVPVVGVLAERTNRMLKAKEAGRELDAELRASGAATGRRDAR